MTASFGSGLLDLYEHIDVKLSMLSGKVVFKTQYLAMNCSTNGGCNGFYLKKTTNTLVSLAGNIVSDFVG